MPNKKKTMPAQSERRQPGQDEGVQFLAIRTELASAANCHRAVERVVAKWGALDMQVNNHAQQISREGC